MSYFPRKPSDSRCSLLRLVFSFAIPLLLLLVFFGKQFLKFNDIGLSNGFSHPLSGWDHLVTMLAVGIWAAQLRGRAIWLLPLAFVSVMSLGGLAGAAGLQIPNVDGVILLSCAVFSVLITRKIRFSSKINVLIVGFFAFFHGFAHGQEISTSASLITYTLGFMLATLLLHGAGILVAKLVVLAATCLLTVLFSNGALAKAADSIIEIKANNVIGYQLQATDKFQDFWWSIQFQQSGFAASSLDRGSGQNSVSLNADSGGQLPDICKLTTQLSPDIAYTQAVNQQANPPVGGAYAVLMAANADQLSVCDYPTLQLFYPSYSSDCSNLDFKNYFPKINHTPGRHFLSNGVGLTSPPDLFSSFVVPRQFQNTSFCLIEASSLQSSIARFLFGNCFTHSLGFSNFNYLSLASSITTQQFILNMLDVHDFNSFAPLFNYFNSPNSFSIGDMNKLHCLSVIPKIPLVAEIVSADQNFFLSKHKSNQLDRSIKIIT